MKTVDEAAIEIANNNYCSEFTVCADLRRSCREMAEFIQQWIQVKEELPENSMQIDTKGNYKYTPQVLYKTKNNKVGITRREEFLDHGFKWRGSGSLQDGIISWRPIELT